MPRDRPTSATDTTSGLATRDEGPPTPSIECDVAELYLAMRESQGLEPRELAQLAQHLRTCPRCRQAAEVASDDLDSWRWLVRVPAASLDEPQLAVTDPAVFSVKQELARGGMGRVSLAIDRRLGRTVALKEILDPTLRERFEREALITSHLQHPAIVPIYDAGTWPDGTAFYSMRLVEGATLQAAIDATTSLRERLGLLHHLVATVEAIAYAHGRGVLHRDLKTTNVLVGELGDTVVIDWGLAKYVDDAADASTSQPRLPRSNPDLTRAGSVMGTPGFMSPEQARGDEIDERADVFALGAMLYTLLASVPPYHDPNQDGDAIMARTVAGPPRPIAMLAPDAPADLCVICERAMAHRAADRYPNAREMAAELRRFEAGQLIARSYGVRELVGRWIRKHRAVVTASAVAVVAIAIVGAIAIVNVTRSQATEQAAREAAEAALDESRAARAEALAGEAAAFEEQGRVAYLAGDRDGARQLLQQALDRGHDTPALRYLLASASRGPTLVRRAATPSKLAVDFVPSPARPPLVVGDDGSVRRGPQVVTTFGRRVFAAAVSTDESWLVAYIASEHLVRRDLRTGAEQWRIDTNTVDDESINFRLAPDDQLLLVSAPGASIVVAIDPATGDRRGEVTLSGPVAAMHFDARGERFAIASDDGEVTVFDARSLVVRARWQAWPDATDIKFLDADHLVLATKEHTAVIDMSSAPPTLVELRHGAEVTRLDVAPPVGLVATATGDGTVRLWSMDGVLLATQRLPRRAFELRFDPIGEHLAATTGTELVVWRVPGLTRQVRVLGGWGDVRWDALGMQFASDDVEAHQVVTFDLPLGNFVRRLSSSDVVRMVGDRVLVANDDGSIRSHDLSGNDDRDVLSFPTGAWLPSADGRRLLARSADRADNRVALVELPSGRTLATHPADEMAISPDGTRAVLIASNDDDDVVRVLDGSSGAVLVERTFPSLGSPLDPTFGPSAGEFIAGVSKGGWAAWSTATLAARTLPTDPVAVASEISAGPSGHFVLFERQGGRVTVHDGRTGAEVGAAQPSREYEESVELSADGRVLAVQNEDGVIELFSVGAAQTPRASVPSAIKGAYELSRDGTLLFTGHADGSARVWATDTGRELDVLHAHRRRVATVQLSPDGSTLLVDAFDGSASLWNVSR